MQYRKNQLNGDEISLLGFGCMRLPEKGMKIDKKEAEKLLLKAVELGINYFDTAYIYHYGGSEGFLGEFCKKYNLRDKIKIATKLPHYLVKKPADIEKLFTVQLDRLQTDYIDYYLIHMLPDMSVWQKLVDFGIIDWIKKKKQSGAIKNIGFSFHGKKEDFIKLIDAYPWEFCQIQYNYLDENNQAGTEGFNYARVKMPVFIMEPLRGGKLGGKMPKTAADIAINNGYTPAELAFRWLGEKEGITCILSGMSEEIQLTQNCDTLSEIAINGQPEKEKQVIEDIKQLFVSKTQVPCTGCGYCMPCPFEVNIPACFAVYNERFMLDKKPNIATYLQVTGGFSAKPSYASLCKKCGKCVSHCPQGINIPTEMVKVAKELEPPMFKTIVKIIGKFTRIKN